MPSIGLKPPSSVGPCTRPNISVTWFPPGISLDAKFLICCEGTCLSSSYQATKQLRQGTNLESVYNLIEYMIFVEEFIFIFETRYPKW